MHLKYFEWQQSKAPVKKQWDPTANLNYYRVRNWCMYIGPDVRPSKISPARWAAVLKQISPLPDNYPTVCK